MMPSEKDLLSLINKDPSKGFNQACEQKLLELKNDTPRKRLIKIIKLLYDNGTLNLGPYLSDYKPKIIELMYNSLNNRNKLFLLYLYLKNIKKYGILIKLFEEANGLQDYVLYDFFKILSNDKTIKEDLNKYFLNVIGKSLPFNLEIKTVDELIAFIDKSMCLKDKTFDYFVLYNYLLTKVDKKKNKRNKFNKKLKKVNISETEDVKTNQISDNPPKEVQNINSKDNSYSIGSKSSNDSKEKNYISSVIHLSVKKIKENNNDFKMLEDERSNMIYDSTKFINYFKERKNYYSAKSYLAPLLDEIIKGNVEINEKIFLLKKPNKNYIIEPHYDNLKKIISIFNDMEKFEKCVLKDKNYGYIYAILDNEILYKEITNKDKFIKDDFLNSDDEIVYNCYKARGLSLEYYLNGILMELFKQNQLPRAIYIFDDHVKNEKNFTDEEKKSNEKENKNKNETKEGQKNKTLINRGVMEEFDGIYYLEKDFNIDTDTYPFIIDDICEYEKLKFNFLFQKSNRLEFKQKSLVLLEVKNRFPENLEKEVYITLNKVTIFYELFEERYNNIQHIRILFFYDAIPKRNYDKLLQNILFNFYKDKNINIKEKIQFQFVFITSSYLAFNFHSMNNRIKSLESDVELLKTQVNELKKIVFQHSTKIDNFVKPKINYDELLEKNKKLNEENIELRAKLKIFEDYFARTINNGKN